jgi:CheY-like chemotaxis protein
VLVGDDNADMRQYLARLLAAQFRVESGGRRRSGRRGRARAPAGSVLADVMMPRLDGFGLLRALRADPTLSEIPLVMLSARAGEEARIEGVTAGADDYLTKPFSARELVARIEANLKMAALRRERRRSGAARIEQRPAPRHPTPRDSGIAESDVDRDRSCRQRVDGGDCRAMDPTAVGQACRPTVHRLIHEDDRARCRCDLAHPRPGRLYDYRMPFRTPVGVPLGARARAPAESGARNASRIHLIDVTARKEIEGPCARPTAARTSSWPSLATSCAIRSRRSATRSRCSNSRTPTRRVRRLARHDERQVAQMVHLVDDLLDVSRISRGDDRAAPRARRAHVRSSTRRSRPARPLSEAARHEMIVALPDERSRRSCRPDAF